MIEDAHDAQLEAEQPLFVAHETLVEAFDDNSLSTDDSPLSAFAASADPDTMYLHEAMRQPDRSEFLKAMRQEVKSHSEAGNWDVTAIADVPEGSSILPAVWQMKRKRRVLTGEIYKYKARLNIDGSRQVKGVNYWDTYAPVAAWSTIRLILIMALLGNWHTLQIDFVLAYTQADVEYDNMYMRIPKGFDLGGLDPAQYVLRIRKNIYGQKQAGRVWNKHLVTKLLEVGFTQSKVDLCVFYHGKNVYVLYTDDSILAGPDLEELKRLTKRMEEVGLVLTVEGDITDFLGVNIKRHPDGTFELTQPHLIEQVLKDLRLHGSTVAVKETPAASSQLLRRFTESEAFDAHFDYRSVIGKLNYLDKCSRPDIAFQEHQCARFAAAPKAEHGKALKWLGRYLLGTKDKGLIYEPGQQSFDCYVDADFSGNWHEEDAPHDPDTARSRTGYIICYANCPIIWASKMQTQVALSTTEAEYIALSTALREVIPIMELLKEMKAFGFDCKATVPNVHCTTYEDNSGCLILATEHKLRPRTKHINTQYHHFREYVNSGEITVVDIHTDLQRADMLTKPSTLVLLLRHRRAVMGW